MQMSKVVLVGVALAGCTRWSSTNVYGPQREVGRQLLGSPGVAETKSSSLSAGFAGSARGGSAVAGLGAESESVTLKHCVQKAELTFQQPYQVRPELRGRGWDIAGAVVLGLVGLGGIQSGVQENHDQFEDESGTTSIVLGSAFIAAGVGLLAYSYGVVPSREPAPTEQSRTWMETRLVEASGCGLPGEVAQAQAAMPVVIQPQPPQDAAARLQQLDKLRAAGAINEADYARKRKEIIDGI
jgi:hypothetical protein